jgi:LacI family transcriptional regulator, galactose operon repressor
VRAHSQPAQGRPTIEDVAAAAGVSRATAARALGGYGRVSDETRSVVRKHAQALGYQANRLAQGMVTGRTLTLGFVSADMADAFFGQTMRGFTDIARAQGYDVIITNSEEDPRLERRAVETMLQRRVDGLLLAPTELDKVRHLEAVLASGLPIVQIDRSVRGLAADAVLIDNVGAARDAVNHLIERGHQRIGLLTAGLADGDPIAQLDAVATDPVHAQTPLSRAVGYLSALRSAGLPVEAPLIASASSAARYADRAEAALAGLLGQPDPPTAILAVDGTLTLCAFEAVQDSGFRFPDECTVLGFDDLDWTRIVRPRVTVVAQPAYDIGATAARRLLARLAGDASPPQTLLLETSLVVRESTNSATPAARRGASAKARTRAGSAPAGR